MLFIHMIQGRTAPVIDIYVQGSYLRLDSKRCWNTAWNVELVFKPTALPAWSTIWRQWSEEYITGSESWPQNFPIDLDLLQPMTNSTKVPSEQCGITPVKSNEMKRSSTCRGSSASVSWIFHLQVYPERTLCIGGSVGLVIDPFRRVTFVSHPATVKKTCK